MRATEARLELVTHRHQLHFAARCRQPDIAGHRQRPGGEGARWRGFGHAKAGHHADAFAAVLLGYAVQPVPDALRQACGGKEEQLDAGKEHLAQRGVLLQCLDQFLPALGYGEVGRGGNLAQIAQGLGEALRGRLAGVQVETAPVVKHDAEVVATAERVVPRQPVHQHRRLLGERRKSLQKHLLIGAQHALGGDHRLGQLGRARGEEEFGDGVRPGGGESRIGRRQVTRLQQAVEAYMGATCDLATHADHADRIVQHRLEGALERLAVADEDHSGGEHLADMAQLGEVLRQQRVGRRHRAIGNTGIHGAEGDLQVFDVVAGKQRQRALGTEAQS